MNKYRSTHLWLLIPFVVVIVGFLPPYWLRFTDAPFRQHLHGLTATAWFVLLIVQPYLVTRGHAAKHRLFGMIALLLAGAVAISALGTIPYNFVNERIPETGKYGLSFIDVVLVSGFAMAVIMAIKNARNVEDHARWMISTVFWALAPGTFRVLFIPLIVLGVEDIGSKTPFLLAGAGIANILVLLILMLRDRRAHPAYLSAAIGNLVMFLPMTVGNMQWWRTIADAVFKI